MRLETKQLAGIYGQGDAYEIPMATVLPKKSELTNLIVPVCHSATHVAYGSTRVEPTFMQVFFNYLWLFSLFFLLSFVLILIISFSWVRALG